MRDDMKGWIGSTGAYVQGGCDRCSGDGKLATTNRAAYYPEKYPDELETCPDCGGLGGVTEEAGKAMRAASEEYFKALGLDNA